MPGLGLGIGFGHQGAAQPVARVHQAEEPLALAHPQRDAVALAHAGREALAVPEIGLQPGGSGRLAHPLAHLFQLLGREPGRPAGVIAFGQASQPLAVETAHPVGERARRVAEEPGHLLAVEP